MRQITSFISLNAVQDAFISGIDSFLDIYQIQNNKNYISSTLGNLTMSTKQVISGRKAIHTSEITSHEVEKANRIKAYIQMSDTKELKSFFGDFGKQLIKISKSKCRRTFINTHYSFIALQVFHHASILGNNSLFNEEPLEKDFFSNNFYDIKTLLTYYLTPDTRHKQVILNLLQIVGEALCGIPTKSIEMIEEEDFNSVNLEQASESDKLWAFMCTNQAFSEDVKQFLPANKFDFYSALAALMKDTHKGLMDEYVVNQDNVRQIEDTYINIQRILSAINNISKGLVAYNLKYKQNIDNPNLSDTLSQMVGTQAMNFTQGSVQMHAELLGNSISSVITKSTLTAIFPPSLIIALAGDITNTLIKISFQSKGYGVVNRHGVTGQVRSFLLKNFLSLISSFMKNHYIYLCHHSCDKEIVRNFNIMLNEFINEFYKSYIEAIKILPNKKQSGSLYYYLQMFADPENNYNHNTNKMKSWKNSKLSF